MTDLEPRRGGTVVQCSCGEYRDLDNGVLARCAGCGRDDVTRARCDGVAVGRYKGEVLCHGHIVEEVEGPNGPARPWLLAGVVPIRRKP